MSGKCNLEILTVGCKWTILNQYRCEGATIIYKVGIKCSNQYFNIQMVNLDYKKQCGILDILDYLNKSIFDINQIFNIQYFK